MICWASCWASLHVGWAERFLRSPTNTVGLRKKRSAQPTCNEAQHEAQLCHREARSIH